MKVVKEREVGECGRLLKSVDECDERLRFGKGSEWLKRCLAMRKNKRCMMKTTYYMRSC
jgi:hypothetical protein